MIIQSFSMNPLSNNKIAINFVCVTSEKHSKEIETGEFYRLLAETLKLFGYNTAQLRVHWNEIINCTDQGDTDTTLLVHGIIDWKGDL